MSQIRWTVATVDAASPLLWRSSVGTRRSRLILPRAPPTQVTSLHELGIINHPERAEVVFVPHETLVQGQVGPDGIL